VSFLLFSHRYSDSVCAHWLHSTNDKKRNKTHYFCRPLYDIIESSSLIVRAGGRPLPASRPPPFGLLVQARQRRPREIEAYTDTRPSSSQINIVGPRLFFFLFLSLNK
jgi:hypothetical protein